MYFDQLNWCCLALFQLSEGFSLKAIPFSRNFSAKWRQFDVSVLMDKCCNLGNVIYNIKYFKYFEIRMIFCFHVDYLPSFFIHRNGVTLQTSSKLLSIKLLYKATFILMSIVFNFSYFTKHKKMVLVSCHQQQTLYR